MVLILKYNKFVVKKKPTNKINLHSYNLFSFQFSKQCEGLDCKCYHFLRFSRT